LYSVILGKAYPKVGLEACISILDAIFESIPAIKEKKRYVSEEEQAWRDI